MKLSILALVDGELVTDFTVECPASAEDFDNEAFADGLSEFIAEFKEQSEMKMSIQTEHEESEESEESEVIKDPDSDEETFTASISALFDDPITMAYGDENTLMATDIAREGDSIMFTIKGMKYKVMTKSGMPTFIVSYNDVTIPVKFNIVEMEGDYDDDVDDMYYGTLMRTADMDADMDDKIEA